MENNTKKHSVHKVLAHSYAMHFFLFLFAVLLQSFFGLKVFDNGAAESIGFILLSLGTVLILWAQYTSHHLNKQTITKETFEHGPYRFTRTPTNLGIFSLTLGFGLIINAFFVIVFSLVSFIFAKLIFLNKQEELLAEKYGAPYLEYKKSVHF